MREMDDHAGTQVLHVEFHNAVKGGVIDHVPQNKIQHGQGGPGALRAGESDVHHAFIAGSEAFFHPFQSNRVINRRASRARELRPSPLSGMGEAEGKS